MSPDETAEGLPGDSARTQPSGRSPYLLLFIVIGSVYLCTFSDGYFGQIGDGLTMFNTAVSLHEFGELGIGPVFENGAMVRSDHYGKYGLGFPLVLQFPLLVAGPLEKALGQGRSTARFPLTHLPILAAVPILIALCLRDLGFRLRTGLLAAAGFAFGTFAWPYISYDFSEPLQALCLTG